MVCGIPRGNPYFRGFQEVFLPLWIILAKSSGLSNKYFTGKQYFRKTGGIGPAVVESNVCDEFPGGYAYLDVMMQV